MAGAVSRPFLFGQDRLTWVARMSEALDHAGVPGYKRTFVRVRADADPGESLTFAADGGSVFVSLAGGESPALWVAARKRGGGGDAGEASTEVQLRSMAHAREVLRRLGAYVDVCLASVTRMPALWAVKQDATSTGLAFGETEREHWRLRLALGLEGDQAVPAGVVGSFAGEVLISLAEVVQAARGSEGGTE